MGKYTVIYGILGHQEIASVEIDSDKPVSELKNKLKDAKLALALLDANKLTLFKVDISVPNNKREYSELIKSIIERTITLNREQELWNPVEKLSTIQSGFPEGKIHILVELPAGESFSSRLSRDVAEIASPIIHYRLIYLSLIVYHSPITPYRPTSTSTSTPPVYFMGWSSNDSRSATTTTTR